MLNGLKSNILKTGQVLELSEKKTRTYHSRQIRRIA